MAPSNGAAPKPSTTYYTPDDETSYSTPRQHVQYGKKSTYPTPASNVQDPSSKSTTPAVSRPVFDAQAPDESRKHLRSRSRSGSRKRSRRSHSRRRSRSRSRTRRSRRSHSRHSRSRRSRSSSRSRSRRRARHSDDEDDEDMGARSSASVGPSSRARSGASVGIQDESDLELEDVKGKGKQVACNHEDQIDELQVEVERSHTKIAKLEKDMAQFKSTTGEVAVLRKQVAELQHFEDDIKTIRTSIGLLLKLMESGANPAEAYTLAEKIALEGATGAVAAALAPKPPVAPEPSSSKRSHKKKVDDGEVSYDQSQERWIGDHGRGTIYRMMGVRQASEIRAPVMNPDGTCRFWVKDKNGIEVLNPKWGPNLGENEDAKLGWISRFIEECQDPAHMKLHKSFLSTVPPEKFVSTLKRSTWTHLWTTYKGMDNGTLTETQEKGRARGREYSRDTAKAEIRNNARKGTVLEDSAFDFLGSRFFQSPENSDAEDSNRKCLDEPLYRSEIVARILDALQLKHKAGKNKPSPASRTILVYYKTNSAFPVLLGGVRIPLWAISKSWIEKNPEKYLESQYMIDMNASNPPDLSQLFHSFPPRPRNYVDHRPKPSKAVAGPSKADPSPPHTEMPSREGSQMAGPQAPIPVPNLDPTIDPVLQAGGNNAVPPVQPFPPPQPLAPVNQLGANQDAPVERAQPYPKAAPNVEPEPAEPQATEPQPAESQPSGNAPQSSRQPWEYPPQGYGPMPPPPELPSTTEAAEDVPKVPPTKRTRGRPPGKADGTRKATRASKAKAAEVAGTGNDIAEGSGAEAQSGEATAKTKKGKKGKNV